MAMVHVTPSLPNDLWISIMVMAEKRHRQDARDYHVRRSPQYHVEENPLTECLYPIKKERDKMERAILVRQNIFADELDDEQLHSAGFLQQVDNRNKNVYVNYHHGVHHAKPIHIGLDLTQFGFIPPDGGRYQQGIVLKKRMKLTAPKNGKRKQVKRWRNWENGNKSYQEHITKFYTIPGNYDFDGPGYHIGQ